MKKFLSYSICLMLIFVYSCKLRHNSTGLKDAGQRKDVKEFIKHLEWAIDNNDRYYASYSPGKVFEYSSDIFKNWVEKKLYMFMLLYRESLFNDKGWKAVQTELCYLPYDKKIKIINHIMNNNFSYAMLNQPIKKDFLRPLDFIPSSNLLLDSSCFWDWSYLSDIVKNFPLKPQGVIWDKEKGYHVYQNKDLETKINYIASFLTFYNNFHDFFNKLSANDLRSWSFDTNTIHGQSKIEPFDLLVAKIKQALIYRVLDISKFDINPIALENVIVTRLKKIFNMPLNNNDLNVIVIRNKDLMSLQNIIVCADSNLDLDPVEDHSIYPNFVLMHEYEFRFMEYKVKCGPDIYKLKVEKSGSGISVPYPQIKIEDKIRVVGSITFVDEVNPAAVMSTMNYLVLNGYIIKSYHQEVSDIKTSFIKEVYSSDVLIPFADSVKVNSFELGYTVGQKLVASKIIRPKGSLPKEIEITLFLPPIKKQPQNEQKVAMFFNEIVKLFCERSCNVNSKSWVALSMSCYSKNTIDAWMNTWLKILQNDITSAEASEGSSTDKSLEVLSYLEFSLRFLDELAAGKSVDEIKTSLDQFKGTSYVPKEALEFIAFAFSRSSNDNKYKFDPECNLDFPHYFDGTTQVRISLEKQ